MEFKTITIVALGVCGALGLILPISAVIIYKLRHKNAWWVSALIGAGTFVLFAMVLESLLHLVMLPIIGDSVLWYCVYGALAAGVFEETGRLVAFKLVLPKNKRTHENAVFMGLGHGCIEVIILVGITMLAYAGVAIYANEAGLDEVIKQMTKGDASLAGTVIAQLDTIRDFGFSNVLMTLYERLFAVTFHVCMSVWVYKAVTEKMWLYPAAIAAHAFLDVFAAMYQKKVITSIPLLYACLTVVTVAVAVITVRMYKKLPEKAGR